MYQNKPSAYHKYRMTKPALQWIIIHGNLLFLRAKSGTQSHLRDSGDFCHTAICLTLLALTQSCQDALLPQSGSGITFYPPAKHQVVTLPDFSHDPPTCRTWGQVLVVQWVGRIWPLKMKAQCHVLNFIARDVVLLPLTRYCACKPGREDFPFLIKHLRADIEFHY